MLAHLLGGRVSVFICRLKARVNVPLKFKTSALLCLVRKLQILLAGVDAFVGLINLARLRNYLTSSVGTFVVLLNWLKSSVGTLLRLVSLRNWLRLKDSAQVCRVCLYVQTWAHAVKFIVFSVLCLLSLTGCDGVCLSPADITQDRYITTVKAYPTNVNPDKYSTYWVDSKYRNSTEARYKLTLTIVGDATFCSGNIKDLDEKLKPKIEMQVGPSLNGPKMSEMKVFSGDRVSFSLKQYSLKIKCEKDPDYVHIIDDDVCEDGDEDKDIKPSKGSAWRLQYLTDGSNDSNLIIKGGYNNWASTKNTRAEFYDFVVPAPTSDFNTAYCAKISNTSHTFTGPETTYLAKYPTSIINEKCRFICNNFASSSRYHFSSANSRCRIATVVASGLYNSTLDGSGQTKKQAKDKFLNTTSASQADIPAMFISLVGGIVRGKTGTTILQTFPKAGETGDNANAKVKTEAGLTFPSLQVGFHYEVKHDGIVGIQAKMSGSHGGYNLVIERNCAKRARKNLIMFLSDNGDAPKHKPGTNSRDVVIPMPTDENVADTYEVPVDGKASKIFYAFKMEDDDIFTNNAGSFEIHGRRPKAPSEVVSKAINRVEDKMLSILYGNKNAQGERFGGAVTNIYTGIITNSYFIELVQVMSVVYLTMLFAFYTFGLAKMDVKQLIVAMFKIAIIYKVIDRDSWEFFHSHLFNLFIDGTKNLIMILSQYDDTLPLDFSQQADFSFLDESIGRFFISETWIQLSALLLSSIAGIIAFIIVVGGIWVYVHAIVYAVFGYLSTLVLISVLLSPAPFFIICVLFQQTSKIFHTWIKVLINNCLKPAFVFCAVAFINQITWFAIYNLLNYSVCDECIIPVKLSEKLVAFCLLYGPVPEGFIPGMTKKALDRLVAADNKLYTFGLPFDMTTLFMFVLSIKMLKIFVYHAASIASNITGMFIGSAMTSDTSEHGNPIISMGQNIKGLVGLDDASISRRAQGIVRSFENKQLRDKISDDKKSLGSAADNVEKGKAAEAGASAMAEKSKLRMEGDKKLLDDAKTGGGYVHDDSISKEYDTKDADPGAEEIYKPPDITGKDDEAKEGPSRQDTYRSNVEDSARASPQEEEETFRGGADDNKFDDIPDDQSFDSDDVGPEPDKGIDQTQPSESDKEEEQEEKRPDVTKNKFDDDDGYDE